MAALRETSSTCRWALAGLVCAFACALVGSAGCGDDEDASTSTHEREGVEQGGERGTETENQPTPPDTTPLTVDSAEATQVAEGERSLNRVVRDPAHGVYAIVSGFGPTLDGAQAAADAAAAPFAALAASAHPTGEALAAAAMSANHALVRDRTEGNDVHGATFAALLVSNDQVEIAHVGDVLVFRLRGDELTRLILGDTVVEDFIREQHLEGADAEELRENAPHREVVVRALGVRNEMTVERKREQLVAGDLLVIGSSALHLALGRDRIASILTSTEGGAEPKARALIDAVEAHEGTDTPTALVLTIH